MKTAKAAKPTNATAKLVTYFVAPISREQFAIEGPEGADPERLNFSRLPKGFRAVSEDEIMARPMSDGEADFIRRMVDKLTNEAKAMGEHFYLALCTRTKKLQDEYCYAIDVAMAKAMEELKRHGLSQQVLTYRLNDGMYQVIAIGLYGRVLFNAKSPRFSKLRDRRKWAIQQTKELADRHYLQHYDIVNQVSF
jgi:hypothetical protein